MEIKDKTENILLSRIEVEAEISFEKSVTPSGEDVKKELSKALEVEADLIVVKKIEVGVGTTTAKVTAYQYLSKDDLKNIEPREKKKEEKKEGEEAAKKEEPKAEKKEEVKEAPKEEKAEAKEEPKPKEKKE